MNKKDQKLFTFDAFAHLNVFTAKHSLLPRLKISKSLFLYPLFISQLFFYSPLAHAQESQNNIPERQNLIEAEQSSDDMFLSLPNENSWEGMDMNTAIENLRVYCKDNFRIFYFTAGEDVIDKTDHDKNHIPDYVEDVIKQLWATQHVFVDILGFKNPLETNYYKNIKHIDVYIVSADKLHGAHGTAFTSPQQALLKPKGTKAIKILLSKGFRFNTSTTITHEYFHIIQNATTQVKNLWFLEGLARWSESVLNKKNHVRHPNWNYSKLLKNKDVLAHVHSLSYDAGKFFWIPLTIQLTNEDKINLPRDSVLRKMKYSNNMPVLQDTVFYGAEFIKKVLAQLEKIDSKIKKDHKIKEWNELNTHHKRNNKYIMKAIELAISDMKKEKNSSLTLNNE